MDLGDVSFSATTSLPATSETTNQEKLYGSGIFFKQESLSGGTTTTTDTELEGDLRGFKLGKTVAFDDFSAPKALSKGSLLRSYSNNFDCSSHGSSQMLCFSSPNSSQSVAFPFYHSSSNAYPKNAGYGGGGMQSTKASFTPSQWMELEHQALIYKYINANVPIPSSLLIPIRKSLDSAGFSAFMGLRPTTYGWGAYHSSKNDPEPGRCRRTDGKKWRCSKDAMSDHKYCERHMNRGRHRSRKLVEGRQPKTSTTTKQMPPMASSSMSATVAAGGSESNSLCLGNNQPLCNAAPSASGSGSRNILDKVDLYGKYQDMDGLSMISPSINYKENQCSIPKPQKVSHESSTEEFGQVSFDSLLNPFNESECIVDIESTKPQNGLLHQFFTDWPNNNNSQSKSSWQDMTQLSISIPSTISDFMSSSTSSPTNDKVLSSPPIHSRNLETQSHREASWIPVNWESSSIGGPLAEVLNNTNNNNKNQVDSKAPSLNLMTGGGWGDGSPYMASSPTGVLQKTAFLSSSNSSAVSSPRASTDVSKAYNIGGVNNILCGNVFVSSHTNSVLPNL